MTSEELKKIIKCGETSMVQFKQEFTTQKEIATEMIAFANSRGGTILFGVKDKTGEKHVFYFIPETKETFGELKKKELKGQNK